ncbi:MAG: hypothetical protein ACE5JN_01290 [Candidatus Methylomirabilia bacterium]
MARFQFVVAGGNHRLYSYLKQKFAGEDSIKITHERRGKEERRQRSGLHLPERRRGTRRRQRVNESDLRSYGFVVIRE